LPGYSQRNQRQLILGPPYPHPITVYMTSQKVDWGVFEEATNGVSCIGDGNNEYIQNTIFKRRHGGIYHSIHLICGAGLGLIGTILVGNMRYGVKNPTSTFWKISSFSSSSAGGNPHPWTKWSGLWHRKCIFGCLYFIALRRSFVATNQLSRYCDASYRATSIIGFPFLYLVPWEITAHGRYHGARHRKGQYDDSMALMIPTYVGDRVLNRWMMINTKGVGRLSKRLTTWSTSCRFHLPTIWYATSSPLTMIH